MSAHSTDAISVARRYATAIFAQALEAKKESAVVSEISVLAEAISKTPDLAKALSNPLVTRVQKEQVVMALVAKADSVTKQAVSVVAKSGRADVLPVIASLLKEALAKHRGERSV